MQICDALRLFTETLKSPNMHPRDTFRSLARIYEILEMFTSVRLLAMRMRLMLRAAFSRLVFPHPSVVTARSWMLCVSRAWSRRSSAQASSLPPSQSRMAYLGDDTPTIRPSSPETLLFVAALDVVRRPSAIAGDC